ncbi:MAG: DnaA regulatory inactivator Hda [Gammaproteobacteria bacterium]|nr:MAG: DnaA regulatory inactivator Hda [Gammaproteobacteria bacterium]
MTSCKEWDRQIPLDFKNWHPQCFETFLIGHNSIAVESLKRIQDFLSIYLWGPSGSGKTHLIQAVHHDLADKGLEGGVLDMQKTNSRQVLQKMKDNLSELQYLCLDNIDSIAQTNLEKDVFFLVNEMLEKRYPLVVSARKLPQQCRFNLEDLSSRLSWGPEFLLQTLNEEQTKSLVKQCALRRGVIFSDDAIEFLFRRSRRDLKTLMTTLDQLDHASLSAQRKLSIPFLKTVLNL